MREEEFDGIIDYDKIDVIIEEHYARFTPDSLDTPKKANHVNQLFLFSGGSATTVGALVKDVRKNGGFSDSAFMIDSETIAEMDIIRNLKRDSTLTKHPEKLRPIDILRGNAVNARLLQLEDVKNQTPPYRTTKLHVLNIPVHGAVAVRDGYVFSDIEGNTFFSGEPHEKAFQATLRYMSQKAFECAEQRGIKTTIVVDDHLEDLDTAKHIIASSRAIGAQTMFMQSYVKPEVAIERGEQRFRNEGGGTNIAYRINPYMQIRTHLHQARNWRELSEIVDGAILTHRNIEGQPAVIIQRVVTDEDGARYTRTGPNKEKWLRSFLALDELPKDPAKALWQLGFTPSTSPFEKLAAKTDNGKLTPLEALLQQRGQGDGWIVTGPERN